MTQNENQLFITEEDFSKNIAKVIGFDCPFFGKILYIYMSDGFDRKKISYFEFLKKLYPLYSPENRPGYNQVVFKMLDIDNDNCLNILNLLHLRMYLPNL